MEAKTLESGIPPYRLRVERGDGAILYERERSFVDLPGISSSTRASMRKQRQSASRSWGCVPLLDFQSSSLGRLRLGFSIRPSAVDWRLEKAFLVLKEDVRKLRYSAL
ncbi:MAG: hypothetical protein GY910_25000 [bacterium]|nr:hypothetical protein [bacterium]